MVRHFNFTSDITAVDEGENEYVPENLIIVMRVISCMIIVFNVAVLVCLVRGRRTFPAVFWYQIVCVTCNDVLAGVSSFIMSYVDEPFFGNHLIPCSAMVGLFFVTQCATLYNILAICISRFVVLKGLKTTSNPWKKTHTIYGAAIAWLVSASLCSTPFLIWADADTFEAAHFCSLLGIVGEHVSSTMKILLGSFLIPLVLTDIMYCLMLVVLKKELREIPATNHLITAVESGHKEEVSQSRNVVLTQMYHLRQDDVSALSETTEVVSDGVCGFYQSTGVQTAICMSPCGQPTSKIGRKESVVSAGGVAVSIIGRTYTVCNAGEAAASAIGRTKNEISACGSTSNIRRTCNDVTADGPTTLSIEHTNNEVNACGSALSNIRRTYNDVNADEPTTLTIGRTIGRTNNEFSLSEEIECDRNMSNDSFIDATESQFRGNRLPENVTRNRNQRISVQVSRLRKAFSLLGLILLALNVFTWPGMIALVLGSLVDSVHFSRALIMPLFSTLTLNSAINPLLYTIRVPEFREAFCRMCQFKR